MEIPRFLWRAFRSKLRDHRAELAAIQEHCRAHRGAVCDVGANKGSFLYWLARWSPRVVAFEPQPDLAQYLSRICAAAGLVNVTVEASAVFSDTGQQSLFIPQGHQPGASLYRTGLPATSIEAVTVPTVSLDDYFNDEAKISVLKIDVEGAEAAVFRGAERILRTDAPLLVFECESRHLASGETMGDVFAYLERLGYRGSFVNRGRLSPVASFREDIHQRQDSEWFWKAPGYCSNFVFAPAKSH